MALVIAFLAAGASAADPLRVEILSVKEQSGHIDATIGVYAANGLPLATVPATGVKASLGGTPLTVTSVATSTTRRQPMAVVLMVDVSGSMAGDPINQARKALTDFVASLEPGDQVAVFAFDSSVKLLQDFTTDKAAATQAVSRLAPLGDTALYDAVIEASNKATQAQAERRLVVLLTDGVATVNTARRAASLDAARTSGAGFVAIGLGADLDRAYLSELAASTAGRFLEAPTPASLKETYANLAASIKTQYVVSMTVPPEVDRRAPAKLTITVAANGASGLGEKDLLPLAGAPAPPVSFSVNGLASGMSINTPATLEPVVPPGLLGVTVEYVVDGQTAYKALAPPYGYQVDPSQLAKGTHLITVILGDSSGKRAEKQITFKVVGAGSSGGGASTALLAIPIATAMAGTGMLVMRRRRRPTPVHSDRIKPWLGKIPDAATAATNAAQWTAVRNRPAPVAADRASGRVILIDEGAVKTGGLGAVREYEVGAGPLTLGTASQCDIVVHDSEDRLGGEEARLWVQRGRLVYHRLTTLSAMATEGVTSGWVFLDSGEDMQVGPYRLTFQLVEPEEEPEPEPEPKKGIELWPHRAEGAEPLGASSE
jgi:Mg-chelatase subunit ChlD